LFTSHISHHSRIATTLIQKATTTQSCEAATKIVSTKKKPNLRTNPNKNYGKSTAMKLIIKKKYEEDLYTINLHTKFLFSLFACLVKLLDSNLTTILHHSFIHRAKTSITNNVV
jgi:hypothetical protein